MDKQGEHDASQPASPARKRDHRRAGSDPVVNRVRTRIEELLKQQHRTKADLAAHLGIRPGYLWTLLAGEVRIDLRKLQAIADFLGVPPGYLLSEREGDLEVALERRPLYRHLAKELTRVSDERLMEVLRFVIESESSAGSDGGKTE